MDAILRASVIYFFLLIVMRLAGQRTMGETTAFDFILLLIIAETTQQAMLGEDFSITNAMLLITTLVGIDILMSHLKIRFGTLERIVDGIPMIIVENGQPLTERLRKSRMDEHDVLAAARRLRGLERMEQIKYAILEANGDVTIIPREPEGRAS
jgi:uncharacterized membrane protein YcaP (DUF421 family)